MSGEPTIPLPPAPKAEPVPFWGYADVVLIAAFSLPSMLVGWALVRLAMWAVHWRPKALAFEAIPEMLIGYGLLFGALALIFRVQYDRPFWSSLGWVGHRISVIGCVLCGFGAILVVGMVGRLMHIPPAAGPLIEMMKNHTALILLAIYGTLVAPLAEELAFRGFLQPLLVRSLGAIGGIALTSGLFGGLHYSEYGDSWRSAFLVALSGVAFGCMRQRTGSTRAAAIMHAAFNGLQFVAMFAVKP